ncbi:hypothetical protein P175DRAFT_0502200 [Aspergillus ochraceoroseus IBT 24754]|uniref:Apple domain-containing protein n=1 Tax=Aspergillus ochraceoroseus IBT 24754 TaxID=1392256 RepID=A0A2T5LUU6_9EURO|nr:uncharacterized protein P175DRAFT_0502200 [Aspergillus ochraceoroseus IBT 24754]PTU20054.1 hypothetical protein P175DRAFT_0502200 [Aspergillus ochraceoroseus IBT 24754]
MRLPELWTRPKSRKSVWLALAAFCVVCSSLVLLYVVPPASWDHPVVAPIQVHSDTTNNNNSTANNNTLPSNKNPGNAVLGDRRCQAFADPGNVLFVIKTGATEVYEKLPTQLLTTLGCVDEFLIFSDLEEQIGPYHVRDTLADFNETLKATLADFELYRLQQEYRRTGQDMAQLKGGSAWILDKYKFLHLVEKTWNERPGREWYFFIETDTYVVWTNFILWLRQISPPKDPLYLGSVAYVAGEPFAHGGSGFLISGKLLERLVGQNPGMANRYDDSFSNQCCGDFVLAHTIRTELDIGVRNYWPQINGEKPSTIPFGPTHWCQPVITMHHLHPRERATIFEFEQARPDLKQPFTFRELSEITFPTDHLRVLEEDWDNQSNVKIEFDNGATPTLDSCRDGCLSLKDCFQYRYSDGECHISTQAFRLGIKRKPEEGRRWFSGWNVEYIQHWRDTHPCKKVEWVKPH